MNIPLSSKGPFECILLVPSSMYILEEHSPLVYMVRYMLYHTIYELLPEFYDLN